MRMDDRNGVPRNMRNPPARNQNSVLYSENSLGAIDDNSSAATRRRKKDLQSLNAGQRKGRAAAEEVKLPYLGTKLPPLPGSSGTVVSNASVAGDKAASLSRVPSISNRLLPIGKSSRDIVDEARNGSVEERRSGLRGEPRAMDKSKISNILKMYSPMASQPDASKNSALSYMKQNNQGPK